VEEVAHKLLEAIALPVTVQRQSIAVTPSIGVAMYPRDGLTSAELVKHADTAMYVAKATGRAGCCFFESAMASQAYAAIVLEGQLAEALEDRQFMLMLQPRVRVVDGVLAGVQALIRWRHPQRGMLSPEAFAEVAIERHLMQPIALWALREVQQLQTRWRESGRTPLPIGLDLATIPLTLEQIVSSVEQVWSDAAEPPVHLGLDLGEAMLGSEPHEARRLLGHLRALGVQVTIDDFGGGGVSLMQLKGMPVHGLTIGRALVSALPRDGAGTTIARAIIGLAQGLNMSVAANGVDTEPQRQWLAAQGCALMQGALIAAPMAAPQFESWQRERLVSRSAS
jgi:EAL domain-containing protein (putative c-di-GMP-specific phosphodiesterase class I)